MGITKIVDFIELLSNNHLRYLNQAKVSRGQVFEMKVTFCLTGAKKMDLNRTDRNYVLSLAFVLDHQFCRFCKISVIYFGCYRLLILPLFYAFIYFCFKIT